MRGLLWLIALFPLAAPSSAAGLGPTPLDSGQLAAVFAEQVRQESGRPSGEVELSNLTVSPAALPLPEGRVEFRPLPQPQPQGLGRRWLAVEVLVDGQVQGRVKLGADLARFAEVPTLRRSLERGTVLTAADLVPGRRNLSGLGPDLLTEASQAIGQELKTSLPAGSVLTGRALKPPVVVRRGDLVTIVAITDSLRVSVAGRVLGQGAKGEVVRVKNLMSRRELEARVVGPGLVLSEM